MSDSGRSFWKTIALLMALALAGVYALYQWYSGTLDDQLVAQDSQILTSAHQVKELDALRAKAEEAAKAARAEMDGLKRQYESEKADLSRQQEVLVGSKVGLEHDIESLNAAHAAALAAEREKTAQAIAEKEKFAESKAEIEKRSEAAKAQAAKLEADLGKMQKAIADTEAEHRTKIAELERHLNDRVALARMTPMDANLLRTAEEVGVLPRGTQGTGEQDKALADARTQLEQAKTEQETTRKEIDQLKAELEQARSDLETARKQHASELETATRQISDLTRQLESARGDNQMNGLQERLRHETKIVADIKADASAVLESAQSGKGARLEDVQAKLAALNERLTDEKSVREDLEQEQAASVKDLNEMLTTTRQDLTDVQVQLDAAAKAVGPADQQLSAQVSTAREQLASLETSLERQRTASVKVQQDLNAAKPTTAADLRALSAGIADLGGTFTDRGLLLRLAENELHFAPGKSVLPGGPLASLDRIAGLLTKQTDLAVRIEGHTDSQGSEQSNLALSKQRAQAVRAALIERGVAADRMVADGFGSAHPIADNGTPEGRSQNRRVEVYILE